MAAPASPNAGVAPNAGIAARIPAKARAFAIATDDAAWLHAGDQIDVFATLEDDRRGQPVTIPMIQNAHVLQVEPSAKSGTWTVTLLVLPDEASMLALAGSTGRISTMLRNSDDIDIAEPAVATVPSLLHGEPEELLRERTEIMGPMTSPGAASLERPEVGVPLGPMIQKKTRFVSIPIHTAPPVRVGDFVDAYATVRDRDRKEDVTILVAQDTLVIDTRRVGDASTDLLVNVLPREGQLLLAAARMGTLHVAVRGAGNREPLEGTGVTTPSIVLSGERAKALQQIRHTSIQVIRAKATTELSRYPSIEAPDDVLAGEEFAVQVSLTEEAPIVRARVVHGASTSAGQLALSLPDTGDEWTLDVVLSAPGFSIAGGNTGQIVLPKDGDSTPAMFRLLARPGTAPSEDRKVQATLWHKGAYLARFERSVQVVAQRKTAVAPVEAKRSVRAHDGATSIALAVEAPDLTVYIRRFGSSGSAEMILASPHLVPPLQSYPLHRPAGLEEFLDASYSRFAGAIPRGGKALLAPPSKGDKDRVISTARGFGGELWRRYAPDPFQQAFWKLRDQLGAEFRSIQVVTDDPGLPWELMRPSRSSGKGKGTEELDFLGIDFRIARWHVGDGIQLERPPQEVPLHELVVVAPEYRGSAALPNQAMEIKGLEQAGALRRTGGELASLADLFQAMPEGIVHFAGHGDVRVSKHGDAQFVMRLEDGDLDVMTWRGLLGKGPRAHPFFFFNACDLGQARQVAGFVEGWAPAVLDAGASGYVGGLWPLGDRGAAEFATVFYRELGQAFDAGESASIADLVRTARRKFYETGDPTHLAYVLYGDPEVFLVDRRSAR